MKNNNLKKLDDIYLNNVPQIAALILSFFLFSIQAMEKNNNPWLNRLPFVNPLLVPPEQRTVWDYIRCGTWPWEKEDWGKHTYFGKLPEALSGGLEKYLKYMHFDYEVEKLYKDNYAADQWLRPMIVPISPMYPIESSWQWCLITFLEDINEFIHEERKEYQWMETVCDNNYLMPRLFTILKNVFPAITQINIAARFAQIQDDAIDRDYKKTKKFTRTALSWISLYSIKNHEQSDAIHSLCSALVRKDFDLAQSLIEAGANLSHTIGEASREIIACSVNRRERREEYFICGCPFEKEISPLQYAQMLGHLDKIHHIIERKRMHEEDFIQRPVKKIKNIVL